MDAFQETLVEELGNKTAFTIPLLGGIPVAESVVVVAWIVMAVLVILALALTSRLSVRQSGQDPGGAGKRRCSFSTGF